MKNFLRKVFEEEFDDSVHSELVKFSRGVFENRYLLECKKQASKWSIKSSVEFANFFVMRCLKKMDENEEIDVKGIIVSTFDLTGDVEFEIEKVKKYMGIQQAVIRTKTTPEKIWSVMEKYPKAFYALSFKTDDCELKVKEKAPKSGKPGSKGEEGPKADFCSLKTTDEDLIKDLFFDIPDFKEVKINHTIVVENIEIPQDVKDPAKMREMAKREGKVIRKIYADGKKLEKEYLFKA